MRTYINKTIIFFKLCDIHYICYEITGTHISKLNEVKALDLKKYVKMKPNNNH